MVKTGYLLLIIFRFKIILISNSSSMIYFDLIIRYLVYSIWISWIAFGVPSFLYSRKSDILYQTFWLFNSLSFTSFSIISAFDGTRIERSKPILVHSKARPLKMTYLSYFSWAVHSFSLASASPTYIYVSIDMSFSILEFTSWT